MSDIERFAKLLRKTPPLTPPTGLREKLQGQVSVPSKGGQPASSLPWRPLLNRWLPALSFSVLFLACLVAIAVQSNVLSELRRENTRLRASIGEVEPLLQKNIQPQASLAQKGKSESASADKLERDRLREEVNRLHGQLQEMQPLQIENQRLRAEIKAAESQLPPDAPREDDPFQAAKAKAQSTVCINNIKRIGLAARLWAMNNSRTFPTDFLSMSNELSTPKILVCPGDTNRSAADRWADVNQTSISYELLSPGISDNDPGIVFLRCPLHNNVGLANGSAHMLNQGRSVVQRDGKWVIREGN